MAPRKLYFRNNRTDAPMNPQRLWQHEQGQLRFKLDEVPELRGEVDIGFHT